MVETIQNADIRAKFLMDNFKRSVLANHKKGMETVEVLILIVVAIVFAGILVSIMSGDDGGIHKIWDSIYDRIETIFDKDEI